MFTKPCGCVRSADEATAQFRNVVRKRGLPRHTLHDLRHDHASLLLAAGTHPKVVSERLGHASIQITLDLYSHLMPGLQQDAALALDGPPGDLFLKICLRGPA